jgi:hypothetical protein
MKLYLIAIVSNKREELINLNNVGYIEEQSR